MLMSLPLHAERETVRLVRTLGHHHPLQRQQLQQVSIRAASIPPCMFPAVSFAAVSILS